MRTVIKNGRIVDPSSLHDKTGTIYIADGCIAGVDKAPAGFQADREFDAGGCLVIPGIVDLSARLREPGAVHKATINSETAAAVRGGITSLCCPPDTSPVIDTPAVVELVHKCADQVGMSRVYCLGAITHNLDGHTLASMHALKEAGCIGVSNAFTAFADLAVLRRALEYAATCNMTVHLYCEDPALRGDGVIHEGMMSARMGLAGITPPAEWTAISNALLLVEQTGTRVHFCRLSSARSIELIVAARDRGLPVSADVAITHLYLTEVDVTGFNSQCHLRPPLRSQSDRDALRGALQAGAIDAVCSDHQPHDEDAKTASFNLTEPGAATIDVFLSLALQLVTDGVLDMISLVRTLTVNPATIAGIAGGSLQTGAPADLCIVDTERAWTVTPQNLYTSGKNCPFLHWEMRGQVTHTFINGEAVFVRE